MGIASLSDQQTTRAVLLTTRPVTQEAQRRSVAPLMGGNVSFLSDIWAERLTNAQLLVRGGHGARRAKHLWDSLSPGPSVTPAQTATEIEHHVKKNVPKCLT